MEWLDSHDFQGRVSPILPSHLRFDRFIQVAKTELRNNPKLQECTPQSFLGAIIQSFNLGLEPGGSRGLSYLVPFANRKRGIFECQFIIGYKGMLELAWRSEKVKGIQCHAVHENDIFEYGFGLEPKLVHKPSLTERGAITHFYCCVSLVNGGHIFEVMTKEDVDMVKNSSPGAAKQDSPWRNQYLSMGCKTVIRKLFKFMPISPELSKAISLDDQYEDGGQNNGAILDAVIPEEFPIPQITKETAENILQQVDSKSKAERIAEKVACSGN